MGSQKDVLFCFFCQVFDKLDCLLEVEFFEKSLSEEGETILIGVTLGEDNGKSELGKSVAG